MDEVVGVFTAVLMVLVFVMGITVGDVGAQRTLTFQQMVSVAEGCASNGGLKELTLSRQSRKAICENGATFSREVE